MSILEPPTLRKLKQLDLACQNRDLPAARRLSRQFSDLIMPGRPFDPIKDDSVLRVYAAEIHGWEIPCRTE